MIQQSKINSFIDSIRQTAEEKRVAIMNETCVLLESEMAEMEIQAQKSAEDYIRMKTASIRLDAGRRISESAAECRKSVFSKRNEISGNIFSEVAQKLRAFTQSESYADFIFESAKNIIGSFDYGNVTLLLRPEDIHMGERLEAELPGVSVSKDSTIKIGGVKGINSIVTLLIDDTLDSRLEQQKRWFEENSELYISMR